MSRFQFVADHRDAFEVKRMCELLQVRRTAFYAWLDAAPARAARAESDALLAERIRAVHDDDNTLGAPRVTAELNDQAAQPVQPARSGQDGQGSLSGQDGLLDGLDGRPFERVNHKRVARVMRAYGIRGYAKRRKVRTTVPEQSDATVPDLLKRDFTAPAPNLRYVGDITYLPIADGSNLYLATVIDCYSRRLVGWSIADHMRTELVEDALKAAKATRGTLAGAIFHSDHGSVYTSKDYAKLCKELDVTRSMGAVGSSADNAMAESFNATFKREVLQDAATWPDPTTCRREAFRWLVRYNNRRRHSWCRYTSPVDYEAAHHRAQAAKIPTAA